ncbi:hypothetical protein [Pseudodesulfovibrio sediminis]|uniref:Uncharacterized protein n=1 Tax=Pseudodesulfovibrio sediminis TaxID=2810563 RepID=A0ABN6EX67_9BACT|nr:hypothetical protein [Pseudodesulfovibrio sediminis]BCS90108.1 hypothetical protein PSDVSF_33500 [Pseudodesulfovibrio sediminis]
MAEEPSGSTRPGNEQRLAAYQKKLRALKERSSLRENTERELLLELLHTNSNAISEFPMIPAQQNSVAELLGDRIGHPGYEFIHTHIANFITLLAHYEKAVGGKDADRTAELQVDLLNTESVLIKCAQGIVFGMALITDNFEEIVLKYFGRTALKDYSGLIEKHELNEQFWIAFVEQFIASRVLEAHKEILEGEKYTISKERNFVVIRFLFDDILSKLNPTDQEIEKTRIQTRYIESRASEEGQRRAKLVQAMLVKELSDLAQFKELTSGEFLQAARITCIDTIGPEFEKKYLKRQAERKEDGPRKDRETIKKEQAQFRFLVDQLVGVGVGASIAVGRISDFFYKALEGIIGEQIKGILPFKADFSMPVLEKILFFLLENHAIHILRETGKEEGAKVQVRTGRARRVSQAVVDALPNMSKIRKKQFFGNDVTREDTLLFKPKTAKQVAEVMSMLSLEPELQQQLSVLWKRAVFRVDIMVLVNLELVAKTSTNTAAKLAEILDLYQVSTSSQR